MSWQRDRNEKHAVRADVQIMELSKSGTSITLYIQDEGEMLGKLVIGRGSMSCFGRKRHNPRRFSWQRFAAKIDGDVVLEALAHAPM
jgi:hypothetical protein